MEYDPNQIDEKPRQDEIVDLFTGINFEFDEEILDLITDTLRDRGIPNDNLLFSGYSVSELAVRTPRAYIFANTIDEFRSGQELGPTSPLQHAVDLALINGGLPAISVYDARLLRRDKVLSDRYYALGSDVQAAHIARFVIN